MNYWLNWYPEASPLAQKIVTADKPIELFKYFTKLTSKTKKQWDNQGKVVENIEEHYPEAIDIIFRAIVRIRVIQPMGNAKMVKISEDINEIQSMEIDETIDNDDDSIFYMWHEYQWASPYTGLLLSSFVPSNQLVKFAKRIRYLEPFKT
jgi:hypothetical protein